MASTGRLLDSNTPAPSRRDDCWGMVASCAVHVSVIASLSVWWMSPDLPRASPQIRTEWTSHAPEPPLPEVSVDVAAPVANERTGGRENPLFQAEAPRIDPQLTHDFRVASVAGPMIDQLTLNEPAPRSSTSGAGAGLGNGEGDGNGAAPAPEFFPLDKDAETFVFVVDSSKSMNHRYPGPAKSRLGRVKVELWRTIYRMTPEQRFFILFFNTQAIPMPAGALQPGGTEGQSDLLQWTAALRADGQTDPQQALLAALRMRPDVIYFLTDGEFNYRVVREVTKANFNGIRIHTLSLGDDSGRRFLQEIADSNGGAYRHIVEEEDLYWEEGAAESQESARLPGMSRK